MRPLHHILHLRERQLGLPVIETVRRSAGGDRIDDGLMVPEQPFVIQIEVIVADDAVVTQGVVKSGVQMNILAVQLQNVPG